MGQTPLDLFHFPGALAHELSQGLHVRRRGCALARGSIDLRSPSSNKP